MFASHRLLAAAAVAVAAAAPAATAPRVATDIAPVQSIVAAVMQGVGAPGLIVPPGASEHAYALRPSEARGAGERRSRRLGRAAPDALARRRRSTRWPPTPSA